MPGLVRYDEDAAPALAAPEELVAAEPEEAADELDEVAGLDGLPSEDVLLDSDVFASVFASEPAALSAFPLPLLERESVR